SGGEQQMLSIGRALMTHPDLVILAEATAGLAPLLAQEIWREIQTIRSDGIDALIVDRDHRRVAAHADELVVLRTAQVALAGPADRLAEATELAELLGV